MRVTHAIASVQYGLWITVCAFVVVAALGVMWSISDAGYALPQSTIITLYLVPWLAGAQAAIGYRQGVRDLWDTL
jgi:hypothetical protein